VPTDSAATFGAALADSAVAAPTPAATGTARAWANSETCTVCKASGTAGTSSVGSASGATRIVASASASALGNCPGTTRIVASAACSSRAKNIVGEAA
jgi:hypothetical protein